VTGPTVTCAARLKITRETSARISWPRCLPLNLKGQPALLLDDELARAVRTEAAAAAVCYHWGVTVGVVWRQAHGERQGGDRGPSFAKMPEEAAKTSPDY
jgi:hypothetical protein